MTSISSSKITVKQSGTQGPRGFQGWTPVIVQVADGSRLVNLLQSYIGGTGTLPVNLLNLVGKYQKADGTWTSDIAQAFDINSGSAANAALATTKANAAAAFAATAGTHAANAAGSENTASTKANEALTSAGNAATANTNAQTAKTSAETAATTATTKAAEALNSANQSAASAASSSAVALGVSTGRNSISPSILLDFANTQQLDSRLTFSRASTATYFDRIGVLRTAPVNMPCFNFNPETLESEGLQIFESSTNLSYQYNVGGALQLTSNFALAPDNTNSAIKIENTPNQTSYVAANSIIATVGFWTRSLFVKSNGVNSVIIFENPGGLGIVNFDVNTKVFSGNVGFLADKGYQICPNGWIRVWITIEKTSSNVVNLGILYIGAYGPTANQHSVLIFGLQAENKRFPTPYIYTSGAAATRQADVCLFSSSLFASVNLKEGTFLSIVKKPLYYFYNRVIGTNSAFTYASFRAYANAASFFDTVNDLAVDSAVAQIGYNKIVTSWKSEATKRITVDNSIVSSNNVSNTLPTSIVIGSNNVTYFLNSCIKKIAYYSKQLSDTEMRELSSVKLSGENTNQLPSSGDLGGAAFMQLRSLLAMKSRSEVNYQGTGAQVSYTIRRPYAFTLAVVNSNGSTTTTLPTANADGTYTADTNYTLLHNAPVGTALTLEIIPVLY